MPFALSVPIVLPIFSSFSCAFLCFSWPTTSCAGQQPTVVSLSRHVLATGAASVRIGLRIGEGFGCDSESGRCLMRGWIVLHVFLQLSWVSAAWSADPPAAPPVKPPAGMIVWDTNQPLAREPMPLPGG